MTDNEIIEALEICSSDAFNDSKERCTGCKYDGADKNLFCFEVLEKDALDLINRQKAENAELQHKIASCNLENVELKAEIDRLLRSLNETNKYIPKIKERTRAEAIKEFWKMLKRKAFGIVDPDSSIKVIDVADGDNLVKEMTEGNI